MHALPTGVVTFVFSDIEASTRILEEHREAAGPALTRHHELLAEAIGDAGGVVFETVGDAVYGAFARPVDAVVAGVAMQRAMAATDWGEIGDLRIRISVHTGAVATRDAHYFGAALFECARLQSLAHGGQTLTSAATAALAAASLPDDITLTPLGRHRLKDLASPMEVVQVEGSGLRREFPPLRASTTIPNNLPVETTSLVGREADLTKVDTMLDGSRLVTLLGPGGTGKTRLAVEIGRRRLQRHPDGVFLVDLSPLTDPDLVATTIAGELAVRTRPGESDESALVAYLAERDILLILDNWEQVIEGAGLVNRLLGGSERLTVLATSRVPLRIRGEARYRLPPLAVGADGSSDPGALLKIPAVRLFVDRALAAAPDFDLDEANGQDVLALCRHLDGLPLAIELAAARSDMLAPAAMLDSLAAGHAILRGGGDLPRRQRTLRDTVTWSVDLLADPELELLFSLGVFAGSFPLSAVAAIATDTDLDPLDGLTTLADVSLLVPRADPLGEPRFAMLETIRTVVLEKLQASGRADDIRTRHAAWVAELAEAGERGLHGPDAPKWARVVALQQDDTRVALAWSIARPLPEVAARIAGAMWWYWAMHGAPQEATEWCDQVLELDLPPRREARVLNTGAVMDLWTGRTQRAVDLATRAVDIYERTGPLGEYADAVNNLANGLYTLGDTAAAEALWVRSAALWREAGDPRGESTPIHNLADVWTSRGEMDRAMASAEESLALARRSGSLVETASSQAKIAEIQIIAGRWTGAEELLAGAMKVHRDMGDVNGLLSSLEFIAALWLHAQRSRPLPAARLLGAADRLREVMGNPLQWGELAIRTDVQANLITILGTPAWDQARRDGAALDLDAAVAYALGEHDPFSMAASEPGSPS